MFNETIFLEGSEIVDEDITRMFLKERQVSGDFISKASDILWRGDMLKIDDSENNSLQVNQQSEKLVEDDESIDGFLKLTKTREWVAGHNVAPANKRLAAKDFQNDSEKRKKFNLLEYGAIKRIVASNHRNWIWLLYICLVLLSVQAAFSYATGVFFSCLYLQLLYLHMDNLSKETLPEVFTRRKLKKIGIRSEDLQYTLEKIFYGSTMAFSSPRLVIPAAIYGLWILSEHILSNIEFELVPAMLGFFAYKAAALVQVYRDNEDLQLIFPDNESL
ncbi:uncharacterized protein M6B38_325470 [Iris pallida]|uniref:Uncharacterized protein n=1 Tax=Iris pallida TaxID=29817 RepID=A0AAX6H896_IRIPA|nr:uncharacterized protein M6B38_325470 [Iris pallida]